MPFDRYITTIYSPRTRPGWAAEALWRREDRLMREELRAPECSRRHQTPPQSILCLREINNSELFSDEY